MQTKRIMLDAAVLASALLAGVLLGCGSSRSGGIADGGPEDAVEDSLQDTQADVTEDVEGDAGVDAGDVGDTGDVVDAVDTIEEDADTGGDATPDPCDECTPVEVCVDEQCRTRCTTGAECTGETVCVSMGDTAYCADELGLRTVGPGARGRWQASASESYRLRGAFGPVGGALESESYRLASE